MNKQYTQIKYSGSHPCIGLLVAVVLEQIECQQQEYDEEHKSWVVISRDSHVDYVIDHLGTLIEQPVVYLIYSLSIIELEH